MANSPAGRSGRRGGFRGGRRFRGRRRGGAGSLGGRGVGGLRRRGGILFPTGGQAQHEAQDQREGDPCFPFHYFLLIFGYFTARIMKPGVEA